MVKPDFYAFLRFCKVPKRCINKGDFFRVCKGFGGFAFRRGAPFCPRGLPALFTLSKTFGETEGRGNGDIIARREENVNAEREGKGQGFCVSSIPKELYIIKPQEDLYTALP